MKMDLQTYLKDRAEHQIAYYERALEVDPDFDNAKRVLQLIRPPKD